MAMTDFDSAFWSDPWLRKRSTHARYLFAYLFTSPHKNRSGAYPIGLDIIVFETGMAIDKVKPALKELEPKVLYDYELEIVFVTNHVRHQYAKKNRIAPTISSSIVTDLKKIPEGHDFIDIFIEKYNEFFYLEGSVVLEYEYYHGKGREGERLKYNDEFEKFWKIYPSRNGKKRGKPEAYKNFLKFKEEEWPLLIECSKNYSKSQKARSNFAKDPERFLIKNYWQDWKEPEIEFIEPERAKESKTKLLADLSTAKDELQNAKDELKFKPRPTSERRVKAAETEIARIQGKLEG